MGNGLIAAQCWVTEAWIILQGVSYSHGSVINSFILGVEEFVERRAEISSYKQTHPLVIWQKKVHNLRANMGWLFQVGLLQPFLWIPQPIHFVSAFKPTGPRKTERIPRRARCRVRTACWRQWPPNRFTHLAPEAPNSSLPSKGCSSKRFGPSSFSTRATVESRYRDPYSFFSSALNPQ